MTTRGIAGKAVILAAVALGTSIDFIYSRSLLLELTAPAMVLFAAALFTRNVFSVHISLFTLFLPVGLWIWPPGWPFPLLAPLALYAAIAASAPPLRRSIFWLHKGGFDGATKALMAFTVVAGAGCLIAWFMYLRPDMSRHIAKIPRWGTPMLAATGIFFGFVNAAIEENIFRGIMMECLHAVFRPAVVVIVIQAAVFGLMHLKGLPTGTSGVTMAAAFGLVQGVLRHRSRGIVAPWLTHACMDMLIFYVLAFWLRA